MSAKYFVVLNQREGQLEKLAAESVTSQNVAAYEAHAKPKYFVLAQADDEEQADRYLKLLK